MFSHKHRIRRSVDLSGIPLHLRHQSLAAEDIAHLEEIDDDEAREVEDVGGYVPPVVSLAQPPAAAAAVSSVASRAPLAPIPEESEDVVLSNSEAAPAVETVEPDESRTWLWVGAALIVVAIQLFTISNHCEMHWSCALGPAIVACFGIATLLKL